jgi:glycosyltransferase involved in cell wall biosynthesis
VEYKLDVYGRLPNEDVGLAFEKCPSLDYKGLVSYDEVKRVIKNSMIVFHTESFEKFYARDIMHGFSTKVADSLASGTCLVLYVPAHITCAKYVKENDCAVVISEPSYLKDKLAEIIDDKEKRSYYIERAIMVAERNHSADKNRKKFTELVNSL